MIKAFIFGITLAIAIGPIAILIVNYGLKEGKKSALLSGTGAALGDFSFALIAFSIGSAIIARLHEHKLVLNSVFSVILMGFGLWILMSAFKTSLENKDNATPGKFVHPLTLTYILTVVNPLTIIAFVGFSVQLEVNSWTDVIMLSTALFLGSFLIQATLAILSSAFHKHFNKSQVIRYLNILSGAGIIFFGIFNFFN